jgi:AcrR family transcriptional regulator
MPNDTFFNLPEAKRARVAEAAIDEFAERGYTGASISRICARAKIAKGSFYQYFDGKIVLFKWLLYDVGAQRKIETIRDMTPPEPGDFWEQLSQMFIAGLRYGLNNPKLSRIAAVLWHPNSDPELQGLVREFQTLAHRNWKLLLQQGQAMGQVRTDLDLDLAVDFALAQVMTGLDLAIQRKIGMDMIDFCSHPEREVDFPVEEQRELVDGIIDLVRRALGHCAPSGAENTAIDIDALTRGLDEVSEG